MAIYGPYKDLAFSRPGYSAWVNVEDSSNYRFIDVTFFEGQIFALCDGGSLVVVEINAPGPLKVVCIASLPNLYAWEQLYLVVYRYEHHETISVEVYKFDLNALEWMKLDDLGNLALFVGDNYSMSISSSSISNCKINCIYLSVIAWNSGGHMMRVVLGVIPACTVWWMGLLSPFSLVPITLVIILVQFG